VKQVNEEFTIEQYTLSRNLSSIESIGWTRHNTTLLDSSQS